MPRLAADILESVGGKPMKMIYYGSMRVKAILTTITLLLYMYFLLAFKTVYQKNKRLDGIMEVMVGIEQNMLKVHSIDQNLGVELAQLDDRYH